MSDQRSDQDEFDTARYPRLAEGLARLADARLEIPRHVDEAVMDEARRVLTAGGSKPLTLRRAAAWIAAAASLGAVVWVGWMIAPGPTPAPEMAVTMTAPVGAAGPGDFDRNGRIDILDAFALARQLEAGAEPARGDMNADGQVNLSDVEAIAMTAVKLPQEAG